MSNIMYNDKLTPEGLIRLGWTEVKNTGGALKKTVYRLKCPYYAYELQLELGDYPKDNPNSGILGIYSPEEFASGIPKRLLYKKKVWSAKDHKAAADYKIKMPEFFQGIAWCVNTYDRLHKLITALTHTG